MRGTIAGVGSSTAGLTGFLKRLAQYYSEFLSTDFKKQRLPRRRLETSDAKGRMIGISLRKYPGFQQKLWEQLGNQIGEGVELVVPRGTWRSVLPKAVADAIDTHIADVAQTNIDAIIEEVMSQTRGLNKQKKDDPEIAFERFCEWVRSSLARRVIAPLLDRLDGFFARTEYKPVESLKEFEDQLSARLTNAIETTSGAAFSILLVKGDEGPLLEVLRDQLAVEVVRAELKAFFAVFASGDLYVDLSDLTRSSRLIENVEFYLHIGEAHYGGQIYPIFYMPIAAERSEHGFKLKSDPHLYVNKRAMDYIAQEVARAEGRPTTPSVLLERIFYLLPNQSPLSLAQQLLDHMAGGFNLREEIDLREPRDQKVNSVLVTVTNRLSFSLFDRSDESMVNDYETLITGIEAGDDVVGFFKALIDDFLLNDPISVRSDVDREWEHLSLPQRLVFDSPLPLVEEQRKILSAVQHPKSRFIAVEGPPGTGKSHTITAIAFNTILSGKSLLVLSDKKEALDVVEAKLDQALSRIRPSENFPNPILRLGKGTSNYARLMKKGAVGQLQANQLKMRRRRPERDRALEKERKELISGIEQTAKAYAKIDIAEIAAIENIYAEFGNQQANVRAIFSDPHLSGLIDDFGKVAEYVTSQDKLAAILRRSGARPGRLNQLAHVAIALQALPAEVTNLEPVFSFSINNLHTLGVAIQRIEEAAVPLFGYLFAGKKLHAISRLLNDQCGIDCDKPSLELARLKSLHNRLQYVRKHLASFGIESEFETAVVLIVAKLAGPGRPLVAPSDVLNAANRLDGANAKANPLLAPAGDRFYLAMIEGATGPLGVLDKLAKLKLREARVAECFASVPKIDYLQAKTRIELLNTETLAEQIDDRLIEFCDTKKNTASTLGRIIREKQKFPVDKFPEIQRAFPCVIASLKL